MKLFIEQVKSFFNKAGKIVVEQKPEFPCNGCVVEASCHKPCDKLERDNKNIKKLFEENQCCIDCGEKKLLEGPSGGMSQNVRCSNCGHEYNFMYPIGIERIGRFV